MSASKRQKGFFLEGGKMKRILAMGLLCLALMLGIIAGSDSLDIKAADGNDTYDNATKLKPNETVTSKLNSRNDVDWYIFEVQDSVGVEWLDFKCSSTVAGFNIDIYTDNDGIPSDKIGGPAFSANSYESQEYSYSKGTLLYVKISGIYDDVDYYISMCTSKEPLKDCIWAVENDDNYDNANAISSSNKMCGILNTKYDEDWYKYTVKNDKPFSFKFQSTSADSNGFYVAIYMDDDGMLSNKLEGNGFATREYTSKEYSYEKGTVIYINISGIDKGIRYRLTVTDSAESISTDTTDKLDTPYSILAGTNVVVGKAEAGATVYVKQGKKTYSATADANGIYRIKTGKLSKGKSVKMWQKVGKSTSKKVTVKIVANY